MVAKIKNVPMIFSHTDKKSTTNQIFTQKY